MATAAHRLSPGVRLGPLPSRTLSASLRARLRGPWLDRELAAGVEPWTSPVHSARSLQITSMRARRALAGSVDNLVRRAERPVYSGSMSAAVPVDRQAVLGARRELQMISARLRDGSPVGTSGVAALKEVISDGAGPLYSPLSGSALRGVLASIRVALDVRD